MSRPRRLHRLLLSLTTSFVLPLISCGTIVQYSDELRDRDNGRTIVVRGIAQFGGIVGFLGGIPFDIAGFPVTYTYYLVQESRDPEMDDILVSFILFPSFALASAGSLLAAPFDLLEYGVYRAWRQPASMTEAEAEQLEYQLDRDTLPRYPVTPLYPRPNPTESPTESPTGAAKEGR